MGIHYGRWWNGVCCQAIVIIHTLSHNIKLQDVNTVTSGLQFVTVGFFARVEHVENQTNLISLLFQFLWFSFHCLFSIDIISDREAAFTKAFINFSPPFVMTLNCLFRSLIGLTTKNNHSCISLAPHKGPIMWKILMISSCVTEN